MPIIAKTRLRIRDQNELLNQIAGTYRDFFRAAMEYVDNSIDAATVLAQAGERIRPVLRIHVDTIGKSVSFTDNCGGMSPSELCDLLSEVGRSKKKSVPWANGQFGFGVHAFRAFAREATFVSRRKGTKEAKIRIDRAFDEEVGVPCETTDGKQLEAAGTRVIISHFEPQVFKKTIFARALISEIEHHFDDVLRTGLIRIIVSEDRSKEFECAALDFASLPGTPLKKRIPVTTESVKGEVAVDLKILDRVQENRLPILTNKQRRVQYIADLRSYKNFARSKGEGINVWSNPFVVGSVEINGLCSPNLSRDDLKDSIAREALYEHLLALQKELQQLVDETMNRKEQESFRKLGGLMSDCLARILKAFRLQFEHAGPSAALGEMGQRLTEDTGDVPFGGAGPGGGGPGPDETGSGGKVSTLGRAGVGDEDVGGGAGSQRRGAGTGESEPKTVTSPGPRIEFQSHAGAGRVIDLGGSLIVNTQHPDFIARNASKSGKIKLDARLLNYVSLVIAPPCVHRLFERKGRVPTALEAGTNIVDLSMRLEQELIGTVLGQEIEKA